MADDNARKLLNWLFRGEIGLLFEKIGIFYTFFPKFNETAPLRRHEARAQPADSFNPAASGQALGLARAVAICRMRRLCFPIRPERRHFYNREQQ
jgi:hypothetical protein